MTAFSTGRRPGRRVAATALGGATATWGAALAWRPRAVLVAVAPGDGGAGPDRPELTAARALGVRYLAQAAAIVARPRAALPVAVAVDALHAGSMIALAAVAPRYRRDALVSAAIAAGGALLGVAVLARGGGRGATTR